jgi:hypothetical protein
MTIVPTVAFVGTIVMLVLMGVLVIFARMATLAGEALALPTLVFTWFTLLFFMTVSISLFTSVFFKRPVDLQSWLTAAASKLEPPYLSRPFDNTVFREFPRAMTLRWLPVKNATHYLIEVQYQLPTTGQWFDLPGYPVSQDGDSYSFHFVGAQPGRWRVTAVSGDSKSEPSKWWYFRHEK